MRASKACLNTSDNKVPKIFHRFFPDRTTLKGVVHLRYGIAFAVITGLSGCFPTSAPQQAQPQEDAAVQSSQRPLSRPDQPEPPPPAIEPSAASKNMANYLQGVESRLLGRGLMRMDDGADITVTTEKLVDIFVNVALYDEYRRDGGQLIQEASPAPLRRWREPIRFQIEHGDSARTEQIRIDRRHVASLATRLGQHSGHPTSLVTTGGNFHILILDEDERRNIAPRLARLVPQMPASDVRAIADLSPQNYCTVFSYSRGNDATYVQAVALIRAELPQRLRQSCFHEEMAQGMGLPNDSPLARPSVFNDDEEFALLTWLDRMLLGMLYDSRLSPGMREEEALPVIRQIAAERITPPSS